MPNYKKLFATGKGFTNTDDAEQFIRETAVDWLSVALGSVHAAIAPTYSESEENHCSVRYRSVDGN